MIDREQLETFATIVEYGSFERAATALHITRSAVSQRIKALEESLKVILLVRQRPLSLTSSGEALLRHVKMLRMLEDATIQAVNPEAQTHKPAALAVAVDADSLAGWFSNVLWRFLSSNRVTVEVITDDLDHTFNRLTRGEVIGCVSAEATATQGFIAEPLGQMEYRCVSTPAFLACRLDGRLSLPGVLRAPAILFDRKDALHHQFLQAHFGFPVENFPRHYMPTSATLLEAIRKGIGYGLAPLQLATPLLATGELVELAPATPVLVPLYWHHWGMDLQLSREITGLVREEAAVNLLACDAVSSQNDDPNVDDEKLFCISDESRQCV